MPRVRQSVIKKRADELSQLRSNLVKKYLDSVIETNQRILVEGNGKGRTESFAEARVDDSLPSGIIRNLRVVGHDGTKLSCSEINF